MVNEQKIKFKGNRFYYYADRYATRPTESDDLKKIDMTEEFWREIESEIKSDELVNITINAKVRMGKSTLGIYISKRLYELLIMHKKRKDTTPFGMWNIARDQQEYSKMMRNPDTRFTVIMTDEINALEDTGENVSVEKALNNVYADVQAGRYVHRVSCSPRNITDPNSDIILEVVAVDRKKMLTHCHLFYRYHSAEYGGTLNQLLGYVNFDVSEIIKTWEKEAKKYFFKRKKSDNDKRILKRYMKEDFYVDYIVKKYEKMDLLNKEGILRPRELDYAEVVLEIAERMRSLMRFNIISRDNIESNVYIAYRKKKIPVSLEGINEATKKIASILRLWKGYFNLNKEINKLVEKNEKDHIVETLKEEREKIMESINDEIAYWESLVEINKKYNKHYLENGDNDSSG